MNNSEKIEELRKLKEKVFKAREIYELDNKVYQDSNLIGFGSAIGALFTGSGLAYEAINQTDLLTTSFTFVLFMSCIISGMFASLESNNITESKMAYNRALDEYRKLKYEDDTKSNSKGKKLVLNKKRLENS